MNSSSSSEALQYLQQPISSSLTIRPVPIEQSDCSYFAQWQYVVSSDSIDFIIQTKSRNKWTGIGFSNSTKMANSDAIIALLEEHTTRHFIMDTWLKDHVAPELDKHQDADSSSARRENGTITVRFSRKRLTGDSFDFQFTDDSCAYFFFPIQGGHFNAINKKLSMHEKLPIVSKRRICIKRCSTLNTPSSTSSNNVVVPVSPDALATDAPPSSSSISPSINDSGIYPGNQRLNVASSTAGDVPDTSAPNSIDKAPATMLTPANDLSAELDSSPSSSTGAPATPNQSSFNQTAGNPFKQFAFLNEPSLQWLAAIACVATLLSLIVFQACFTLYRNKQAHKQNVYRQNALKQSSYLHGAFIADSHSVAASATANQLGDQTQLAMVAKASSTHHVNGYGSNQKPGVKRMQLAHASDMRHHQQHQTHAPPHLLHPPGDHYRVAGHYRAAGHHIAVGAGGPRHAALGLVDNAHWTHAHTHRLPYGQEQLHEDEYDDGLEEYEEELDEEELDEDEEELEEDEDEEDVMMMDPFEYKAHHRQHQQSTHGHPRAHLHTHPHQHHHQHPHQHQHQDQNRSQNRNLQQQQQLNRADAYFLPSQRRNVAPTTSAIDYKRSRR